MNSNRNRSTCSVLINNKLRPDCQENIERYSYLVQKTSYLISFSTIAHSELSSIVELIYNISPEAEHWLRDIKRLAQNGKKWKGFLDIPGGMTLHCPNFIQI
ncbi:hypothetical protein HHI36_003853, partial [Cryptolaemus montrouzieri]